MSNKIKAIILKNLMDELTLVETLNSLKINYLKTNNNYIINSNLKILKQKNVFIAEINELDLTSNKMLVDIIKMYDKIFEEKIKLLQLKQIEKEVLESIKNEEVQEIKRREKKELLRLESIRRVERKALDEQIQTTVNKLIEKSEKLGYNIREERHGKERVFVLVRRQ